MIMGLITYINGSTTRGPLDVDHGTSAAAASMDVAKLLAQEPEASIWLIFSRLADADGATRTGPINVVVPRDKVRSIHVWEEADD